MQESGNADGKGDSEPPCGDHRTDPSLVDSVSRKHPSAEVLRAREPFRDPGDLRLLRRYERERAEAILAMRATIHGLFVLFGAEERVFGRLRNAGLNLVDRLAVLKNVLMRHAMN